MSYNNFERDSVNQIRVHVLPSDRFKTYAITAYIGSKLSEETVTSNALIPFVLRRGNESFPETKKFREKLDEMYGAGFGFDILKRGDYQMIQFRLDMIEEKYVKEDRSLLAEALEFMGQTLTQPLVENGGFRKAYVKAEKNTLQKRIESLINDKIRYAAERCIEEMCEHEPYRLHPLGKIEDIPEITAESLFKHYLQWLKEASIDLYIVGNTSLEEIKPLVQAAFKIKDKQDSGYRNGNAAIIRDEVKTVVEKLDVTQGKLNMGLRSPVTYADDNYAAAMMYNGILGSFPHSKLFINVREKASLAYYAASRMDGQKGIITIQSGIEIQNFEKAKEIILKQLDALANGQISELEMNQTKAMLQNQLREIQDSAFSMTAFDFNNRFCGIERTTDELIEAIQATTTDMVKAIAEKVRLDTIYFLSSRKEEA